MGGGSWTTSVYTTRATAKADAGLSTFDYTDQVRAGRASGVNALVDPKLVAGDASPHKGQVMLEVMISDEHPNPTPIAVILDVTGSNYHAAVTAHGKLPQLHGLLQRKGYAEDPQILFGAIGDAHSDDVPLQMGQFESDNRMDEQLEALFLEGNGGGQVRETYELAAYFLARHTYLEPYERHGKKGYVFFIGDEMPYDVVRRDYGRFGYRGHTLESLVGDTLEADIATKQIFDELQERYDVFFLFQKQGSYREEDILPAWRELLGERALVLDDPAAVCETIAAALGMLEAGYDLDEVMDDLTAIGADSTSVQAAGKALAVVSGTRSPVAKTTGNLPDTKGPSGTTRL
jgi:hypothetical protein